MRYRSRQVSLDARRADVQRNVERLKSMKRKVEHWKLLAEGWRDMLGLAAVIGVLSTLGSAATVGFGDPLVGVVALASLVVVSLLTLPALALHRRAGRATRSLQRAVAGFRREVEALEREERTQRWRVA